MAKTECYKQGQAEEKLYDSGYLNGLRRAMEVGAEVKTLHGLRLRLEEIIAMMERKMAATATVIDLPNASFEVGRDILSLAGVPIDLLAWHEWTPRQREEAVDWAGAVHWHESGNDIPAADLVPPEHIRLLEEG